MLASIVRVSRAVPVPTTLPCGLNGRWRGLRTANPVPARQLHVNGKEYATPLPGRPVVAVCLDGSAIEYITEASKAGMMPFWKSRVEREAPTDDLKGHQGVVACVMPTFTNPNNVAIVTGTTPKYNGICGNYFLDRETGKEVMMNDAKYLRCPTILAALSHDDVSVRVVTAKDKLLKLLAHGLSSDSIAFSCEKAHEDTEFGLSQHGTSINELMREERPPTIYDPDISTYLLRAGVELVRRDLELSPNKPAFYYLSTTDYVQHKYAPGEPEANDFYGKVDSALASLSSCGAVVGLTADHGMNSKVNFDGSPAVLYVESELTALGYKCSVILPITDPYVVHHGALGSYATVYLDDPSTVGKCMEHLRERKGVHTVMDRNEAVRAFDLPEDRIGDFVVIGDKDTTLGRTPDYHDLSNISDLRSHGGLEESYVPMWFNSVLKKDYQKRLMSGKTRNFHLFEYLLNGLE